MIETLGYWYQRVIAGPFVRGRIKNVLRTSVQVAYTPTDLASLCAFWEASPNANRMN